MKVLVDTCVLSEVMRPAPDPRVRESLARLPGSDVFISVLTMGELMRGVARIEPGARRRSLEAWIASLEVQHSDRILGIDLATARAWGELAARAAIAGRVIPAIDGLIAATAHRHGMHVMTRNTQHYASTGAAVIDPWEM